MESATKREFVIQTKNRKYRDLNKGKFTFYGIFAKLFLQTLILKKKIKCKNFHILYEFST
jgi:hypothetical protein